MQEYIHLVDLVKSFPTSIYLQNSASIQSRTSLSKFGGDPIHFLNFSFASVPTSDRHSMIPFYRLLFSAAALVRRKLSLFSRASVRRNRFEDLRSRNEIIEKLADKVVLHGQEVHG